MQKINVQAKGLYTFPNQLSEVPLGALFKADNVVIDREGVLESRRGYNTLPGQLGTDTTHRSNQIFSFADNVLSHYGPLNAPTTLAFYSDQVSITGTQTSGSPIITAVSSIKGLYVGQYVLVPTVEQAFTGAITLGNNLLTNVPDITGLFVGQEVGSIGIPTNTTISAFTGTGPYTVQISHNAIYTDSNAGFNASNSNLLSFPTGTRITAIGTNTITLSNNATLNGSLILNCYGWIDFTGTYLKPNSTSKMRSVEANNNVYFTTSQGVQKLDSVNDNIVLAGAPDGLDGYAVLDDAPTGFMLTNTQIAYRVVWGYQDSNQNLILGVPSQRIEIANTSGSTKNVDLNITIPQGVTVNYFYQLYRSAMSANSTSPASDEMAQVFEGNPDGTDLTNGFVTILDETPESLRNGPALYTSPSQEGILQENTAPPFCQDLTLFKGSVFYANTQTKQNLTLNILSVSGQFSFFADLNATNPTTIQNIAYSVTGDVTTGSSTISNISPNTANLGVGQTIFDATNPGFFPDGTGTLPATVINQIIDANTIIVSNTSTGTSTGDAFAIIPQGIEVGQIITGTGIPANTVITNIYTPIQLTGNVVNGSPIVTNIPSTITLLVGQPVTGPGIPANTFIQSIDSNIQVTLTQNVNLTVTGDLTNGSPTIHNISNTSFLVVNQSITDNTHSFIPANTVITAISGTTVTISHNASGTATGDTLQVGATVSPFNVTGNIVSGGNILSGIVNTSGFLLAAGQTVSDNTNPSFLPSPTTILSVIDSTDVNLDNNALSSSIGDTFTLVPSLPALQFLAGIQISNPITIPGSAVTLTVQNGSSGIQVGDTLTIAGITYTASTIEDIASKEFKVFAQGTPAQNISDTSNSLVRVINRTTSPTPTIYAFYLSGFNDLPGKIYFEERIFGSGIFNATASSTRAGKAYSPNLPTSGTTVASTNDVFTNGLYYSKTQQPEAVPILNFIKVGSAQDAILRIIGLRDSLFILKEDGIYRLTGTDPTSFQVDIFDSTTIILSAESAVPLNNLIFMYSKYGIVTVSDTGVTVVSRAIEDQMLNLLEVNRTAVENFSFGINYESDRKYIFFSITEETDQYPTQAYVYNTFTQTWTRWVLSQTCGLVHPSKDILLLGDSVSNTFDEERKTRTFTDYTDSSFPVNLLAATGITATGSQVITGLSNTSYFSLDQLISGIGIPENSFIIAITSTTLTINNKCTSNGTTIILQDSGTTLILDSLTGVVVGDVVYQTDGRYSIINSIDITTGTVTVQQFVNDWVYGPSFIYKAFKSVVTYVPQTAQNAGAIKQFREAALLFQVPYFNLLNLGFSTDFSSGTETVPLNGLYGEDFGRFPWGNIPWGGVTKAVPIRTYVPQQKQRCSLLNVTITHQEAYAFYRLNGITFVHNATSERIGK